MAVISLLDVNALIALAWPNHVHHEAARSWFVTARGDGWATCPLTEAGFVRVSCNPSAVRHEVTPNEAIALLRELRRVESHSFWPLEQSVTELPAEILGRIQGYRQITDAILLDTAIRRGGRVATFDSGLARLAPGSEDGSVFVIPV